MSDTINSSKKRILVVDNDSQRLESMRSSLEPQYQVGTVNYGPFANEYVRQNDTDLILMDVEEAVKDGFALFKSIRNLDEGANVPVIFITGKDDRNSVLEAINLGVDGYLIKPVAEEILLNKVNDVLTRLESMKTKKVILAIDDDVTYLKIINNALKDNFNVVMVNSSKLAMEYLNNHKPDVIILDYQLSKYKDISVWEYLIDNLKVTDIPIIMMTGINDKKEAINSIANKPCKFLLKPISKLDLLRAIISALSDYGKSLR